MINSGLPARIGSDRILTPEINGLTDDYGD
jgi:hypothetical protein